MRKIVTLTVCLIMLFSICAPQSFAITDEEKIKLYEKYETLTNMLEEHDYVGAIAEIGHIKDTWNSEDNNISNKKNTTSFHTMFQEELNTLQEEQGQKKDEKIGTKDKDGYIYCGDDIYIKGPEGEIILHGDSPYRTASADLTIKSWEPYYDVESIIARFGIQMKGIIDYNNPSTNIKLNVNFYDEDEFLCHSEIKYFTTSTYSSGTKFVEKIPILVSILEPGYYTLEFELSIS